MAKYTNYHLNIRRRDDPAPKAARIFLLPEGTTQIGYDPVCDIFLDDRTVSGRHAKVEYRDGHFTLSDLQSRYGTRVKDDSLPAGISYRLEDQDQIEIGNYILIFEQHVPPKERALGAYQQTPTIITKPGVQLYPYTGERPPGVSWYSLNLLHHLPNIYQMEKTIPAAWDASTSLSDMSPTTFLARFLALFESVLLPIEWVIENFDFYLDMITTPVEFFPWLESWYGLPLIADLPEEQRRNLLRHAHELYNLKGSRTALVQVLELCTGCTPRVDDLNVDMPKASFSVEFQTPPGKQFEERLVRQLIDAFKPVHTTYSLKIT